MKVRWIAAAGCIVFAMGLAASAMASDNPPAKPEGSTPAYVGVTKCKMCHGASTGNQFKIWSESKHAQAFTLLASPEAKAVGEKAGVADPQTSEKCLGCHVAGFSAPKEQKTATYKAEDGVSCEACHGPGSNYIAMAVMKDPAAAKAKGLLTANEETCVKCHNKNSPTFKGFVYADMVKKIAHPDPKLHKAAAPEKAPEGAK